MQLGEGVWQRKQPGAVGEVERLERVQRAGRNGVAEALESPCRHVVGAEVHLPHHRALHFLDGDGKLLHIVVVPAASGEQQLVKPREAKLNRAAIVGKHGVSIPRTREDFACQLADEARRRNRRPLRLIRVG